MWNVGFDQMLGLFPDRGRVKIVGFADDAALIVVGPNPQVLRALMQSAIDKVLKWGDQHGLHFAPQKTVAVLFTRRTREIAIPP